MKRIWRTLLAVPCVLAAASCSQPTVSSETEAHAPTMGWNTYNTFNLDINEQLIIEQAEAMANSGLKDAGYRYINIDDGYFGGRDPETGRLLIHPDRFPNGLKDLVDHIHSLGLKAGIYSDAGTNTCGNYWGKDSLANNVGLYGHDVQDCEMFFNELGFDFIKVDYCGGTTWQNYYSIGIDEEERYRQIRQAMDETGRKDLRLSVCRWNYPGTWVSEVGDSWRMSQDINCSWRSIRNIIDQSLYISAYASKGHYNDMDMLEVGRTLSQEEDMTHFGMWCILSSPLIIGCDMTTMRPETLELLTNPELIALNQDPLGLQAYVAKDCGDGTYVFVKDIETLHGKTRAIALYNSTNEAQNIGIEYSAVELGGSVKARDLFARTDVETAADGISVEVPAHGTRIYRLEATQRIERSLYEAETAFLSEYQELHDAFSVATAYYEKDAACSGGAKVVNLGRKPKNDLRWLDVYSETGGEYEVTIDILPTPEALQISEWDSNPGGYQFFLSVNDGVGNRVRLDKDSTSATITVTLPAGSNVVRLYDDRYLMPGIDRMILRKL
ncbi:MAG: alpha-galactosidase [Bacteroidales bacterium]|nr:alpha-galactosidase [Bacteroidales bacterium]